MNGADHYRKAEDCLAVAREMYDVLHNHPDERERVTAALQSAPLAANALAEAQVHATLAQAAAAAGPSAYWAGGQS